MLPEKAEEVQYSERPNFDFTLIKILADEIILKLPYT